MRSNTKSAGFSTTEAGFVLAGLVLLTGGLAADNGGYPATSSNWGAVAAGGLLIGATLAGLLRRPLRLELAFLIAAGGLAAWTWLSAAWSTDLSQSVLEGERMLLYLAVVATLVLAVRRRDVPALLAGLLTTIACVCAYALGARLFPGSLGASGVRTAAPESAFRLAEPLGYSNALGLFAALGLLLALGFAVRAGRAWGRALSAVSLPLLGATLYLTFGRGAWLALGAGLVAALLADSRRLQLATGALALTPAPALAVLLCSRTDGLTRSGASHADAVHDGRLVAAATVVLAGVSAAAAGLVLPLLWRLAAKRPRLRRAYAVSLLGALALAAGGALAAAGGPVALADRAYDAFSAPPPPLNGNESRRLLSLSGHGRSEYWRAALHDAGDHLALGSGAGSFQRYWLQHRKQPLPVRDAHSLYLETLAELGPVGLALLLVALALPLAALTRARRSPLTASILGAYVAYLVHAGFDWDWELPAVTLAGLACGAALLLLGGDATPPAPAALRSAAAAAAILVALAAGLGYMGNRALAAAENALDRSDYTAAESDARSARRWTPWSADSWRLQGEAEFARGEVEAARASLRRGLEKDGRDWELWLDLGLASEGSAQRHALAEAERLNPLSPEVAELRTAGA